MAADRGLCIGLDVGTSGVKAVLVAADGAIVASATSDYPLLTPRPGWTGQEPQAWWRMSILNTARVGWFSSDRTIAEYAEEIWRAQPLS